MKLLEIPGIGKKTYDKLVEYFGSEDEALRVIEKGAVSVLSEVLGSPKKAIKIVQSYKASKLGVKPNEVFGDRTTKKIFEEYLSLVIKYASSRPAKDQLETWFPLPSRAYKAILERQKLAIKGLKLLSELSNLDEICKCLAMLDWPRKHDKLVKRTVVIVRGYEPAARDLEKLRNVANIVYIDSLQEVTRVIEEHGVVFVYGFNDEELPPGAIGLERLEPLLVLPEIVIGWIDENKKMITAIKCVLEKLGVKACAILDICGEELSELLNLMDRALSYTVKGPKPGIDEEYDRLSRIVEGLETIVFDVATWANEEIKRRLEKLEVRLSGIQLLRLIEELSKGYMELPSEIVGTIQSVIEEAYNRVGINLGLKPDEAHLLEGLFRVNEASGAIEVDEDKLNEIKRYLHLKLEARRLKILGEAALRLKRVKEFILLLFDKLVELDISIALARFIRDLGGSIPSISAEYLGVAFINGIEANLALAEVTGEREVQRISYVIGETPYRPDNVKGEHIVILTGANSGGKTTLLKTVAEIVLAAQAGLPVIAEKAWVGVFDKIYFFEKPVGMVDAGALESTLKTLASIASISARKLILVDELEAMTEARAAARIIAGFINELARDKNCVSIIVSHLAEEIISCLDPSIKHNVRIDGIEAVGLDQNYNLIVDRNPRYYYLARSTPELVVMRLIARSKNVREREFFNKILGLLRKPVLRL